MDAGVQTWLCTRCKAVFTERRERCPADGRRVIMNLRGTTFGGRWQVQRLLGVGGDGGSVWQATAPQGQRDVALKVLPASDRTAAQRFERGARISGMLEHKHLTQVIEHGSEHEWVYLVMELLEGETLQRLLARVGRIAEADVVLLADQLLQALTYVHGEHVLHRDLKPANIFLTSAPDGQPFVKVLDFGISKIAADPAVRASALDSPDAPLDEDEGGFLHITQERQILGTPEYMAPEQITGNNIDQRSDLYALGVLFYRMLVGELPFQARSRVEMYRRHLYDAAPPFPPEAGISEAVAAVVLKALAKEPGARWQSASAMRQALLTARTPAAVASARAAVAGPPPEVDPIPTGSDTAQRGSRRLVWLGLAGAAGAVAIMLALVLPGSSEPREPREAGADEARGAVATEPAAGNVGATTSRAGSGAATMRAGEADAGEADAGAHEVDQAVVVAAQPDTTVASAEASVPDAGAAASVTAEVVAAVEPQDASFNLSSGGVEAEVTWKGRVIGSTPLLLSVVASDLPAEVTLKRAGYRTATRMLTRELSGQDLDIPLARIVSKKSDDASKPTGNINLQR